MSYQDFLAFRRSLPRTPRLERQTVRARGISFAVFSSPPVEGAPPILCINGGMLYDHSMLWPALSPLASKRQVFYTSGARESSAPANPRMRRSTTTRPTLAPAPRPAFASGTLGHSWGGGIMLGTAADPAEVRWCSSTPSGR